MNEEDKKIALERYNKAMKEMVKAKTLGAHDTLEAHYQKVHNENVKQENMRNLSNMAFDSELGKYGEETNRRVARGLNKRIKYYEELDNENIGQLQKDAELAEKINKGILEKKQKREKEIQENKERKRIEREKELEDEEIEKQQKEADMAANCQKK